MLSINSITLSTTTSTSIIPDITEKTQLRNIASTYHFPPPEKNLHPSELDTLNIRSVECLFDRILKIDIRIL
ncbi:hypothetical protein [Microcoleus sp.]|uniref:hypothetical protein n=1 Tax=Microcoleus sp. TaxID=44472 RepID=UPI00359458E1